MKTPSLMTINMFMYALYVYKIDNDMEGFRDNCTEIYNMAANSGYVPRLAACAAQGKLHFPCDSLRCLPFCVLAGSERLSAESHSLPTSLNNRIGGDTIAIYHCSMKIVSRGKGKSAVAAAAYRSGEKLINEWDGMTHDYTRKASDEYRDKSNRYIELRQKIDKIEVSQESMELLQEYFQLDFGLSATNQPAIYRLGMADGMRLLLLLDVL